MGSNTITPPALNRNSSDDEILGLLTQPVRRTTHREIKSEVRDSSAQESAARVDDQMAMDFGHEVEPRTQRDSATDTEAAGADAEELVEPEHLRAAMDANPELRDA